RQSRTYDLSRTISSWPSHLMRTTTASPLGTTRTSRGLHDCRVFRSAIDALTEPAAPPWLFTLGDKVIDAKGCHYGLNGVREGHAVVGAAGEKESDRLLACGRDDQGAGIARHAKRTVHPANSDLIAHFCASGKWIVSNTNVDMQIRDHADRRLRG